jgi:methylated-DNA-[protein]-cysteine S-methyltransferase
MRSLDSVLRTCSSQATIQSPLGPLWAGFREEQLLCILWDADTKPIGDEAMPLNKTKTSKLTESYLQAYFAGDFDAADPVATQLIPRIQLVGTSFQKGVWQELLSIPRGKKVAYKEFVQTKWTANHTRPVASAIGKNPISILIPCHRVVGSDGKLHGFAGGLEAKAKLLELENDGWT